MKTVNKRKQWNLTKYRTLLRDLNAKVRNGRKTKDVSPDEWHNEVTLLLKENPELPAFLISLGIKRDAEDKLLDDIAYPTNADKYTDNRGSNKKRD